MASCDICDIMSVDFSNGMVTAESYLNMQETA